MCLWTRNFRASASSRGQSQPPAGVGGDLQPHLAMVFQMALAQVVDQQRQVQQVLFGQAGDRRAPAGPASDQSSVANSTARRQCSSTVYL